MKNATREERKTLFNAILNKYLKSYRLNRRLTQEMAAEKLDMSVRSYISHENSNVGFQGISTANFLLRLSPEELEKFREEYKKCMGWDEQ